MLDCHNVYFFFLWKKGKIDHIRIYLMNANDAASNCSQNDDARKKGRKHIKINCLWKLATKGLLLNITTWKLLLSCPPMDIFILHNDSEKKWKYYKIFYEGGDQK